MNIEINVNKKGYRISSDRHQFILSEIRISKTSNKRYKKGEKVYKDIGFYTKLETLINSLCMLKLKASDATTLKDLKEEILSIRTWLNTILL